VIAASARLAVEEGQLAGVGVGHEDRLEQPLRVAMQLEHLLAFMPGEQALQRLRFPLLAVDRLGLLAVLVHRQHQATVQQFFVQVDGRGVDLCSDSPLVQCLKSAPFKHRLSLITLKPALY